MPLVVQAIAFRPVFKQEDVTNRRRSARGLNPYEDRALRAPLDFLGPMQHRFLEQSKRVSGIGRRVHFRCHRVPPGDHGPRASLDVLFLRLGLSGDDQPDRQANAEHHCLSLVRFSGVERRRGFACEHFASQPKRIVLCSGSGCQGDCSDDRGTHESPAGLRIGESILICVHQCISVVDI